ncbi:MAG: hypothetical protein ACUVQY_10430 [Thermoproteota archaeon]
MTKIGGLKIYIPDELERKFREAAMRLFGYGKGSLSKASEKAFELWLASFRFLGQRNGLGTR